MALNFIGTMNFDPEILGMCETRRYLSITTSADY